MPKLTLKAARVNKGLTQTELAEKVGVSLPTICNWETGETIPKVDKIGKLLEVLEVKFEEINFLP